MRKDELERCLKSQKLFLLFHNQVVCPLGIVAVSLIILGGVRPRPLFVNREVAFMNFRRVGLHIHVIEQRVVLRSGGGLSVFGLEHLRVFALHWRSIFAVLAVMLDLIDEEQAQDLHADLAGQAAQLLAEAELSRAGDIIVVSVERLAHASTNQMREMFRLVWQREGWPMGDMDFARWNRLVEIVRGSRSACDFPGEIRVRRVGNVVQMLP